MKTIRTPIAPAIFIVALLLSSCSKNNNSLAPFSPEITNATDQFQLQATGVKTTTTTITYTWNNTGVRANVDKSGVLAAGAAKVYLYDANNTQLYLGDLNLTGSEQSAAGTPGTWTIKLVLTGMSGDLNFRVQKGG
jgi:hypothetical protein